MIDYPLAELMAKTGDGDFLRNLVRRGLKGVKLVISDAHEGLKAAITRACPSSEPLAQSAA